MAQRVTCTQRKPRKQSLVHAQVLRASTTVNKLVQMRIQFCSEGNATRTRMSTMVLHRRTSNAGLKTARSRMQQRSVSNAFRTGTAGELYQDRRDQNKSVCDRRRCRCVACALTAWRRSGAEGLCAARILTCNAALYGKSVKSHCKAPVAGEYVLRTASPRNQ